MSAKKSIQERISAILKDALEKKKMSATYLSTKTKISSDRIDRILNGKFVRPIKREELNLIIEELQLPRGGATLRSLNSLLGESKSNVQHSPTDSSDLSGSQTLGGRLIWNDQPDMIDNMFDFIRQRILNNNYAIIKDTGIEPFPSTFDDEKRLSVINLQQNGLYFVPDNLFFNFLISPNGIEDIIRAYEQMHPFFVEDLHSQCELRDYLMLKLLSNKEYSLYKQAAEEMNLMIPPKDANLSHKEPIKNIYFISVFDNQEAYESYIHMCEKLNLSTQYYAVYVNFKEEIVESTNLKFGHSGEKLIFLK